MPRTDLYPKRYKLDLTQEDLNRLEALVEHYKDDGLHLSRRRILLVALKELHDNHIN